jgi:hypothetical protein
MIPYFVRFKETIKLNIFVRRRLLRSEIDLLDLIFVKSHKAFNARIKGDI